ncbi:MAG: hypothetical protein F6K16_38930, partial [Symploca sp. SIO2B6]|nr:hypothetical protein [Symploca sp. SIO2B6]
QETADANLSAERLLRLGYPFDTLGGAWQTFNSDDFTTTDLFTLRQTFWQRFDLRVERFGYREESQGGSVRLPQITTYRALLQNYYKVCDRTIDRIAATFPQLFQLFSPFASSFSPDSLTEFSDLGPQLRDHLNGIWQPSDLSNSTDPDPLDSTEPQYALQYFYDYLSQLVAAYQELIDAAFELMDDCHPDTRRFPKFLMLGLLSDHPDALGLPPSPYRNHFTQPPIYNGNNQRVKQVRHLYERLRQLCQPDAFFFLPFFDTPLKITPSRDRSVPLSQQAIPYYLNYPNLYRYWNYDAYRKGISDRLPAYFHPRNTGTSNQPTIDATDDLLHRLDGTNFYRIEGHIGESNTNALREIQNYQQRYNLAFDVIALKLAPTTETGDLNLSGYFDDLNADFGRIKDRFLKLWDRNEDEWSENPVLNTLRQGFFAQAELQTLTDDQISNPVLRLAKDPENYQFLPQADEDGDITEERYRVAVIDPLSGSLREVVALYDPQYPNEEIISFPEQSPEELAEAKQQFAREIAAILSADKLTFSLDFQQARNRFLFQLRFTTETERGPAPISFRALQTFTVTFDSSDRPILSQSAFRDFETLYSLLRDVPESANLPFSIGNRNAADCLNYFEIKGLIESYQQRIERLKDLHLFHKFAEQHPGMEHLGGVPNGGTFVLVYVDADALTNVTPSPNSGSSRLLVDPSPSPTSPSLGSPIRIDPNLEFEFNPDTGSEFRSDRLSSDSSSTLRGPGSTLRGQPITAFLAEETSASLQERFLALLQNVTFPANSFVLETLGQLLLNRPDIVVADFCLPYRCGSDNPSVNYVLAAPRPVVLLEKSAFCTDDTTRYEFLLDPEGGMLRGEGSFEENGRYYFQPSRYVEQVGVSEASGQMLTFTYVVDNRSDTFTVVLYPPPTGVLPLPQRLCNDTNSIGLQLQEADPTIEIIGITVINERLGTEEPLSVPFRFNPSQYAQNNTLEDLVVVTRLRDRRTNCTNTISQTLTIYQTPEAGFDMNLSTVQQGTVQVRVFNITPQDNQEDFDFRWTIPLREDRDNRDDFAIEYKVEELLSNNPEISLTVTNRESEEPACATTFSRSIVGVLGVSLAVNNDPFGPAITESETFERSQFSPNGRYSIQAFTVPEVVGSVQFSYQNSNGDQQERIENDPPYSFLPWEPTLGVHRFRIQAFAGSEGKLPVGGSVDIIIRIIRDNDDSGNPRLPDGGFVIPDRPPLPPIGGIVNPGRDILRSGRRRTASEDDPNP